MTAEKQAEEAFRAAVPGLDDSRLGPGLGAGIMTAFARGRSAFPALCVDERSFAGHLARALARRADDATLATLAVEDLYLTCACVIGIPGAANLLAARHGKAIRSKVERVVGKPNGEEIVQEILSDLLVGSLDSPPELAAYSGRAPLARWLEVVAHRAALRWRRSAKAQARVAGRAAIEPRPDAETPTDTALFRERYGIEFQRALKEALKRAPQEDRSILRFHFVNNISVEKIGKMLGVSQPTASRRLAQARERVLADVKDVLTERLKISSREIKSLAGLLRSRLDLSIARLLRTGDAQS